MKAAIAAAVLLVLGGVGFVVMHQSGKERTIPNVIDEAAEVATITTGKRVDIEAHVPRQGLCIVEFTATF